MGVFVWIVKGERIVGAALISQSLSARRWHLVGFGHGVGRGLFTDTRWMARRINVHVMNAWTMQVNVPTTDGQSHSKLLRT